MKEEDGGTVTGRASLVAGSAGGRTSPPALVDDVRGGSRARAGTRVAGARAASAGTARHDAHDVAHGKGDLAADSLARRPRAGTDAPVHSRGFPFDVGIHDLDPALRHSVPVASSAVKRYPEVAKTVYEIPAEASVKMASSGVVLPAFVVEASVGRWRQLRVQVGSSENLSELAIRERQVYFLSF